SSKRILNWPDVSMHGVRRIASPSSARTSVLGGGGHAERPARSGSPHRGRRARHDRPSARHRLAIFLVIGGLLLGLVPGTPRVEIDPDLIFLFVLPPLLYTAAFFTPLRSLRANLGAIGSLAVGLVVATAF